MAVSSLVSNQVECNNGENQNIPVDHSSLTNVAQTPSSASLPSTAHQMRDELATKAALKEIDHKKIQDKSRKRQRKTNDQKNILENEYVKDPNWDYEKKCELALALNFTFAQVSKWNWDRRKKNDGGQDIPVDKGKPSNNP